MKIKRTGIGFAANACIILLSLSFFLLSSGPNMGSLFFLSIFTFVFLMNAYSRYKYVIEIDPIGIKDNGLLLATMDECTGVKISGDKLIVYCKNRQEQINLHGISTKDRMFALDEINNFLTSRCTGADYV